MISASPAGADRELLPRAAPPIGSSPRSRRGILLLLLLLPGCSRDPLDRHIAKLDHPDSREQAIEQLLRLVQRTPPEHRAEIKRRVIHALGEAYKEDHHRGTIVAALGTLHDPLAEEVLVAALQDAERGGEFFEAAVRAARLLGELQLKRQVPTLVAALKRAHAAPRADRNSWLERSLIQALDRLGDPRAVEILIRVLGSDPVRQDFYLNKLAASALGRLGDRRAIPPLVASLTATSHGLLLFEESRRALCQLGPATVPELLAAAGRRDRRGRIGPNAIAAARVIADLGQPAVAEKLLPLIHPRDPESFRLALAESTLRLGHREGEKVLREILGDRSLALSQRRHAAELLGWYGDSAGIEELTGSACQQQDASHNVLCWSVALAFARLAGPDGLARLDDLLAQRPDAASQHYLQTYRSRLTFIARCSGDPSCLVRQLGEGDWRLRERAALELGRPTPEPAAEPTIPHLQALARTYRTSHDQVKQAILVSMERLLLLPGTRSQASSRLAALLEEPAAAKDPARTPPAIVSRAICLAHRLRLIAPGATPSARKGDRAPTGMAPPDGSRKP